jgi:hypothetical protein
LNVGIATVSEAVIEVFLSTEWDAGFVSAYGSNQGNGDDTSQQVEGSPGRSGRQAPRLGLGGVHGQVKT